MNKVPSFKNEDSKKFTEKTSIVRAALVHRENGKQVLVVVRLKKKRGEDLPEESSQQKQRVAHPMNVKLYSDKQNIRALQVLKRPDGDERIRLRMPMIRRGGQGREKFQTDDVMTVSRDKHTDNTRESLFRRRSVDSR